MTKRTANFVSAIAASFLAGAPLATPSQSAPGECLSGPKDSTPEGGHWHYRVDHATKRHCWYLGDERSKLSQASPSEKSARQKSESALPRAVADAYAELLAASDIEQADDKAPVTDPQPSIIASRWPDQALPNTSVKTNATAPAMIGSSTPSGSRSASTQNVEQWTTAEISSPSRSDQSQGYSLQALLAAMAGALALAGIVTSLFLKFRNSGAVARRNDRQWSGHQTKLARDAYPVRDRASEFFAQISQRDQI